ncbi:MAG: extracellular solute-binding protein [Clostridia bacterium]|nr:extracellular solute-binding protein [Clostridia bacterium]
MIKKNRVAAILLAACFGVSWMSACQPDVGYTSQQETETDADISEHVVLTMYCIGDEGGKDAQEHLDELNKILTEKINAEIDPVMISWGDYSKKLPMLWENGDPYDLTYTSNWTGYFKAADKGAFKEITDLFPEYAPKTYEEYVEKDLLETTKVNGKPVKIARPKDAMKHALSLEELLAGTSRAAAASSLKDAVYEFETSTARERLDAIAAAMGAKPS